MTHTSAPRQHADQIDDQALDIDYQPPDDTLAPTYAAILAELEQPTTPARPPTGGLTAPTIDQGPAFQVVDLASILNGNHDSVAPYYLRGATSPLIYPGKFHDLHGEPSAGKTWVALHTAVEMLTNPDPSRNDGALMFIDWEDSPRTFVGRMLALGCPPAILGDPTAVNYVTPLGALGLLEKDALLDLALRTNTRLLIVDAMAGALALDGADENSNTDVTRWVETSVKPLTRAGITVIALDHVIKHTAERTRGARGAGAKLAHIDGASYEVIVVRPYSRTTPGEIKLKVAKDREGHVGPIGSIAAHIHVTPDDGALTLTVIPAPQTTDDAGHFIPTVLMTRVSRHFESLGPGEELSARQITGAVKGKDTHLRTAIERLVESGHLTQHDGTGRGRGHVYTLSEPYRPPEDEGDEA